jgi:hypothetical protein
VHGAFLLGSPASRRTRVSWVGVDPWRSDDSDCGLGDAMFAVRIGRDGCTDAGWEWEMGEGQGCRVEWSREIGEAGMLVE